MGYLGRRVYGALAWRLRAVRRRIRRIPEQLRSAYCRLCIRLGWPLPESLRDDFFRINGTLAEVRYEAQNYPGAMVVFRAPGFYSDPALGWGRLAAGGVESYEIPGEHTADTRTMFSEPYVALVAQLLQDYLERTTQAPKGLKGPKGQFSRVR
jgi:hypothetical protein